MLGGVRTLGFIEPDLDARFPESCDVVAAALMVGFSLLPPPQICYEERLIHPACDRLQKFKDADRRRFTLEVLWHFRPLRRRIEGESMTVNRFRAQWDGDARLRAALRRDPNHVLWCDEVKRALEANPRRRTVLAVDGTRQVYGLIHGDPETLRDMAAMHANGGVAL